MKRILLGLITLFCLASLVGCSEKDKDVDGEFLLGQFGTDWKKETYYVVVPIRWTGDSSITINSIELVKNYPDSLTTYEEDGIKYEFLRADPSKKTGIYFESGEKYGESDLGELKNINGLEVNGEGRFVLKLSLGDVKVDNARRLKIKFDSDGEEVEKIVVWKTLEQITTEIR